MRQPNKFWRRNKHLRLLCHHLVYLSASGPPAPLHPPVPHPIIFLSFSNYRSAHIDLCQAMSSLSFSNFQFSFLQFLLLLRLFQFLFLPTNNTPACLHHPGAPPLLTRTPTLSPLCTPYKIPLLASSNLSCSSCSTGGLVFGILQFVFQLLLLTRVPR